MRTVPHPLRPGKVLEYRTVEDGFDPRRNSLNFLRLFLAVSVVVSHTMNMGFDNQSIFGRLDVLANYNKTSLGTFAVYGFFGISGFLIASSASRNNLGRYLWQRFLRIFPGFWVAIILTGFLFSLVGWLTEGGAAGHVSVMHYLFGYRGPANYVAHNALLKIEQPLIYGTLWNVSLWTLFYEFICYLMLGALIITGLIKHRVSVLVLALVFWATQFVITNTSLVDHFSFFHLEHDAFIAVQMYFIRFGAMFLVGAVVYFYRDVIPDSGWLALGTFAVFAAGLAIPSGIVRPDWDFTYSDLMVPLLAYPMIWLGMHLPLHRVGAKNDYSYGVYIYAYPVQALLALWGVAAWGYAPFLGLTLLGTIPFAVASWWLIEKRAMSLKKLDFGRLWERLVGPPSPARPASPPLEVEPIEVKPIEVAVVEARTADDRA